MPTKTENLLTSLKSLCVFRSILYDPVISALCSFLEYDGDDAGAVSLYCGFVSELYKTGSSDLSKYVGELLRCCDNPLARRIGEGKTPSESMKASADREIAIMQKIAGLTPKDLRENLDYSGALPEWENSVADLIGDMHEQLSDISKHGYGIYAKYRAFYYDGDGIRPVKSPDGIRLGQLVGYKREKEIIIENTRALLASKPAANILLTGDAGTGKSSTVKAVVNELAPEGLRILELKKEQLKLLPEILSELNHNPLKFIIFIDDLSFAQNDDNFSALKAMLEGTVSAKAGNVAIYATSNRRHLVKEKFSDREGDDVHRADTMQEIVSLSERFGLHVTFSRPDKTTYLEIVRYLCDENGVSYDPEKLDAAAEKYALGRASRSARAAKQFVDLILSGTQTEIK